MSIYDVVNQLIQEVDAEIERKMERVFELARDADAFVVMTEARRLHRIMLDLCASYDDGIDSVFEAVNNLDAYLVCPF